MPPARHLVCAIMPPARHLVCAVMAPAGFASAMKNEMLKALVASNVKKTLERVRVVAPNVGPDDGGNSPVPPVAAGVLELVDAATSIGNLCRMEATWHPWF